jgi:hypothetical protein
VIATYADFSAAKNGIPFLAAINRIPIARSQITPHRLQIDLQGAHPLLYEYALCAPSSDGQGGGAPPFTTANP